ncbi:CopG family transcriptional regulator [Propionivibrio sp.]|uniref:CopG family transcriptional regulator n=1 Tax=Propionivibrio sp. TaxID=2212460 RepID=UPI003BF0DFDA
MLQLVLFVIRLELAMSTTTIRLPEALKDRVAEAAKRAGTTSHGFILSAIAEKAAREELRADFDQVAEDRFARIVASGQTIPWQDMRAYLEERLAGNAVKCPTAQKLVR